LWHIYPFYILVDRAGAAAVTLLTKEIPLRLLVEKKADVMMDSKGCQNQNFTCITGPVKLNEMLQYSLESNINSNCCSMHSALLEERNEEGIRTHAPKSQTNNTAT